MPRLKLEDRERAMILALMLNFSVRSYEEGNIKATMFLEDYFKKRQKLLVRD